MAYSAKFHPVLIGAYGVCYYDRQCLRLLGVIGGSKHAEECNHTLPLLVIGVFVLVGCGASEPGKADSIEDIVGTWQRVRVDGDTLVVEYCRFSDEGTYLCADSVEKPNGQEPLTGTTIAGGYWFEGPQYYANIDHGETLMGPSCANEGVYEILLLASGILKHELMEGECDGRVSSIVGSGSTDGKIEWAPVQ